MRRNARGARVSPIGFNVPQTNLTNTVNDDQHPSHKQIKKQTYQQTNCNGARLPLSESRGLPCPTEGRGFRAVRFAAFLGNTISPTK